MARHGFVRGKLEIKFLVLYIADKMAGPINLDTLYDLAFCDPGVDYFEFVTGVAELVDTKHLTLEDNLYSITKKGRQDNEACESSLAFSVKQKCNRNVIPVNNAIRRDAMVKAYTSHDSDGNLRVNLLLNDPNGNLFHLNLVSPTQEQCDILCNNFKRRPERIFNDILDILLAQEEPKVVEPPKEPEVQEEKEEE